MKGEKVESKKWNKNKKNINKLESSKYNKCTSTEIYG